MARVMIDCPVTGNPAPTGINLSSKAFEGLPLVGNILRGCPECGGRHAWAREDAYLEEDWIQGAAPFRAARSPDGLGKDR